MKDNPQFSKLRNEVEKTSTTISIIAQTQSLSEKPAIAALLNQVVKTTTQSLDTVSDLSGQPPIPQNLSVSLETLKSQGLITPEESEKLHSFKSRGEVREELEKLTLSGQFPISELNELNQAVAASYPDFHQQTSNLYQFAELRGYQSRETPSDQIRDELKKWQQSPDKTPPPPQIRPYLYLLRAEKLSEEINLSSFSKEQQSEVVNFFPQAANLNPTFSTPSAQVSPDRASQSDSTQTPAQSPSTAASPSSAASDSAQTKQDLTDKPNAAPYLIAPNGPLPGDLTYFSKQFAENWSLATTLDPRKRLELQMKLADERLAEANSLAADPKKASVYEQALKRYQQSVADSQDSLKKFKGDPEDKKDLAEKLEEESARHNIVFEKGLLPPPQNPKDQGIFVKAVQATENAMDQSADSLGRPALPSPLVDRLQDLKAQGLIVEEEVKNLTSASSREEVRKKIRELTQQGSFPPADAKKLDEAQSFVSPQDFNQLIEVRKVEELQRLRAVQSQFAQTATLRNTNATLIQTVSSLVNTIDPAFINKEDLSGREDLLSAFSAISATISARPLNGGQFGPQATPGASPSVRPPGPSDALLSTCPIGAVFKQFEGCVWEANGKPLNDYEQYRCQRSGEYWSFSAGKCIPYSPGSGRGDDKPVCPVPYSWSWETQSCQRFTGGILPIPPPGPQATPSGEKELEERRKSCPDGSTYQPPQGCVWDESNKPVYDQNQYRCPASQYYSFEQYKCVPNPKPGEKYAQDAWPKCQEQDTVWSWPEGKCVTLPQSVTPSEGDQLKPSPPSFLAPDNPLYFLKRAGESLRSATAFSPKDREALAIDRANERLSEALYLLEKNDQQNFQKVLGEFTSTLQETYKNVEQSGRKLNDGDKKILAEKFKQVSKQQLILQKATIVTDQKGQSAISGALSASIQAGDRAADLEGQPAIPPSIKEKIENLPKDMLTPEEKQKLLDTDSRVEARIKLGELVGKGVLSQADSNIIDQGQADPQALLKLNELKKLNDIVKLGDQQEEIQKTVIKTEDIAKKLDEFRKTFEVGKEIPAEIRPYVRLTRIDEVASTIRPDIVKLEDFGNRKDVVLAVATLKEEFRPTREAFKKIEDFRRKNPGLSLPVELARIEALSYGLGIRGNAAPCFLPTPPFPANTPCPPPGAAIPIVNYTGPSYPSPVADFLGNGRDGKGQGSYNPNSTDKDGKPLIYGQGPKSTSAGVCPSRFHWMYDNGGWCMSDTGTYGSTSSPYTPFNSSYSGRSAGYTPYSPFYSSPGAPPGTSAYPVGDNSPNDGCPYGYDSDGTGKCIPNSYPASTYSFGSYSPPSYYGPAPTNYTTNPLPGTVPGTGPPPISPGQCPAGFHWMPPSYNQAGWCMADGNTYVPGGTSYYPPSPGTSTSSTPPPGGYNCGSQPYDPVTKKCADGACPGGFNWDGGKCVASSYYSPNLTQSSCGPGYYWDGRGCIPTSSGGVSSGSGSCPSGYWWNGYSCQPSSSTSGGSYYSGWTGSSCSPPSSGCGYNNYWDSGTCSCRPSGNYYGGAGPSPSNSCQGISCSGGTYLDYGSCTCRTSYSSSSSSSNCQYPSGGCTGSGAWFDWSSCSCKTSTSTYSGGGSTTGSSCTQSQTCGSGQWFDWGSCSCKTSSTSTGSTSTSGSSGSSSGSCPSGYHWMSDNGGWCMSDGGSSGSTTTTTSPPPSTTTEPSPSPSPEPSPSPSPTPEPTPPPPSP